MQRAAQVFYDIVLNYETELLSPQIDQYSELASKIVSANKPKQVFDLNETKNLMNLNYLS